MSYELHFSRAAFRQIDAADSWWRENRPASPDLFSSELEAAIRQVSRFPTIFADLGDPRMPGLRRLLMPKSRYYLYWTTHGHVIEVLAVWHTSRGTSPLDHGE